MTDTGRPKTGFGYVPALDGVRAVSVIAVMLFHAGFGFATGGFLGVSVFFTLSGFLITSLLIAEHADRGRLRMVAFYNRRARRLLPAAYLTLAMVLAASHWWTAPQRRRLPGDVVTAAANVFNWRAATATVSYRDLFSATPSPLAHFWSLAIEEQCYLVIPAVVAWALLGGRRRLGVVAGVLLAASVAAALLTSDFDLGYNGTHVRIAEVLVGMVLAVVLSGRRPSGRWTTLLGLAGLAGLVAATAVLSLSDTWLARGGLAAFSLCSVAMILGSLGSGVFARVLGCRPLVAIGKVSYGLYLFHWPIFLLLDEQRTDLSRWPLFGLRMAVTAVAAAVSFWVLERPVRERRVLRRPTLAGVALVAVLAGLVATAIALPGPKLSATEELLQHVNDGQMSFDEPKPTVLVVGSDRGALDVLDQQRSDTNIVDGVTPDCPLPTGYDVQLADGSVHRIDDCPAASTTWPALIGSARPDVLVVSMGPLDDGLVRTTASAAFPVATDQAGLADWYSASSLSIVAALQQVGSGRVPIVLYWPQPAPALQPDRWREELVGFAGVDLATTPAELQSLVDDRLAVAASSVPRVLVIGDSTSLPFAVALDHAAAGSLRVQWAGHGGCPFVQVDAVRAYDGGWKPYDCDDYSQKLPPIVAKFHPDAIVLVAGGMELIEQRYPGDPNGYIPGSPGYQARHDEQMAAMLAALGPSAPPVIVADAPPIEPGGFSSIEMSDAGRLASWNAQIRRWADQQPLVKVLAYTDALMAYEAQHGTIRKDGSHPEIEPLTEIMRDTVLPRLMTLLPARTG